MGDNKDPQFDDAGAPDNYDDTYDTDSTDHQSREFKRGRYGMGDNNDIVARLNAEAKAERARWGGTRTYAYCLHLDAAVEIETLRAELDDWHHNIALEAFTAEDADLDTMLVSLRSRIADARAVRSVTPEMVAVGAAALHAAVDRESGTWLAEAEAVLRAVLGATTSDAGELPTPKCRLCGSEWCGICANESCPGHTQSSAGVPSPPELVGVVEATNDDMAHEYVPQYEVVGCGICGCDESDHAPAVPSPPEPDAPIVAWRVRRRTGWADTWYTATESVIDDLRADGFDVQPLYAHPPLSPVPSEVQVEAAARAACDAWAGNQTNELWSPLWLIVARAALGAALTETTEQ